MRSSANRMVSSPASILTVLALALSWQGLAASGPESAPPAETQSERSAEDRREVNPAADEFLLFVNKSDEKTLRAHDGLIPEVVSRIMAHRSTGSTFASISEFMKGTGIRNSDFDRALRPFYEKHQRLATIEQSRKPIPEPGTSRRDEKLRSRAVMQDTTDSAAPKQISSADTEGPIGSVRPGFFMQIEGYENWDGVDQMVRKEFYETLNREHCSCGCVNETLAFCYVNDPGCPVVRARVKKIYDDLMAASGQTPPKKAAPSGSN